VAQTLASIALARAIQRTGEARWPAASARSGGGPAERLARADGGRRRRGATHEQERRRTGAGGVRLGLECEATTSGDDK
jgi:hypothetical protein